MTSRVLYLIGCAAPPVEHIRTPIELAQADGWDVCLALTPSAARWVEGDLGALEGITGHPVRVEYRLPNSERGWPPADAMVASPVTFNSLNKWAAGIADTLPLGLLTEAIGLQLPLVALPYLNAAQAAHPALDANVSFLRAAGVAVLLGDGGFVPHVPKHGRVDAFPWRAALDALPQRSGS